MLRRKLLNKEESKKTVFEPSFFFSFAANTANTAKEKIMWKIILMTATVLIGTVAVFSQTKKAESVYTDLASEKCRTIESHPDEGGSYRGQCKGVGGYKLEVLEGDLRQTINVIAPTGKKYELELWNKVSSGFSAVGDKAEWRVVRMGKTVKPTSLIFRFNASNNPEKPEQNTSYLIVVKITETAACVTDVVKPAADANETARKSADNSVNKPCRSGN